MLELTRVQTVKHSKSLHPHPLEEKPDVAKQHTEFILQGIKALSPAKTFSHETS